jgi:hypothetical protein
MLRYSEASAFHHPDPSEYLRLRRTLEKFTAPEGAPL